MAFNPLAMLSGGLISSVGSGPVQDEQIESEWINVDDSI